MNMKRRLTQYPETGLAGSATMARHSASAAGGSTSSASRMKTHSWRKGRCSSAQFFFFGQVPLKANCTTWAPWAAAIAALSSVLCESTTTISSAQATEARQRGRLAASFLIGIRMETGTRAMGGGVAAAGVGVMLSFSTEFPDTAGAKVAAGPRADGGRGGGGGSAGGRGWRRDGGLRPPQWGSRRSARRRVTDSRTRTPGPGPSGRSVAPLARRWGDGSGRGKREVEVRPSFAARAPASSRGGSIGPECAGVRGGSGKPRWRGAG